MPQVESQSQQRKSESCDCCVIFRNRYLVRLISIILLLVPAIYLGKEVSTPPSGSFDGVAELKSMMTAIRVFAINGIIINSFFILYYLGHESKRQYTIKCCGGQFGGLQMEYQIISDFIMMGILGFIAGYGVYISPCRLQYKPLISLYSYADRWCEFIGIGLAFALISAGWYLVILVLDIGTVCKSSPREANQSSTSTEALNQQSQPLDHPVQTQISSQTSQWPPPANTKIEIKRADSTDKVFQDQPRASAWPPRE